MVKANEFRIGNYCMDEKSGAWLIVDEIKSTDDGHVLGFYVVDRSKYPLEPGWQAAPILLTPELLERLGFEKDKDDVYKHGCMYWMGDKMQIALDYAPLYNVPCKYMHQLQNLYFALTSAEIREPVK